jgi:F-type H+-transporting ATPase subunit gamma
VGGKAARFFRKKGLEPASSYEGLYGRYSEGIRNSLARDLAGLFLKGVVSEAYLAYTSFISTSRHQPVVEKILNIERPEPAAARYLTEPGAGRILEGLIPLYISAKIKQAMLNAFASEHAIRLFAMSEATDNAGELLDGLLLLRNKVRQAGITTEIIEVISSASAMKG